MNRILISTFTTPGWPIKRAVRSFARNADQFSRLSELNCES